MLSPDRHERAVSQRLRELGYEQDAATAATLESMLRTLEVFTLRAEALAWSEETIASFTRALRGA